MIRLDESLPGRLGRSLEEVLPQDRTRTIRIDTKEQPSEIDMPYDGDRQFNLNIYDDGPAEGKGSHNSGKAISMISGIPYLRDMFDRTLAETEILTAGKVLLLLERYQGKSVQLPAHEEADDSVYGSLAVYRREIIEELAQYGRNRSVEQLDETVRGAIKAAPDAERLGELWEEIKSRVEEAV